MRSAGSWGGRCGCPVCGPSAPDQGPSRRTLLAGLGAVSLAAASPAAARPAPRSGITILEPSWLLVFRQGQPTVVEGHSVVIDGDRIVRVVEGPVRGRDRRVPMPGQILMPGLISGHTHTAAGTVTRGLIESGRTSTRPLELIDSLDDADLDALTAHNLFEILRSGCTTQVEMSLTLRQVKSYVRVARRWGVRGYPGGMTPSMSRMAVLGARKDDKALFDSEAATLAEIAANLAFGLEVAGADEGRIRPMATPHGPETQTPATLRATADWARRLGNGIHIHLAQGGSEGIKRLWGKSAVQWLDEFGLYEQRLFGAHMSTWDVVADSRFLQTKPLFSYVHCPSATGAGGAGPRQPFIEALGAGLNTCVGLDSTTDMIENMRLALLYGRARHTQVGDASPVWILRPNVSEMIKAVTLNPAKGLGRDDLGRIAVGAKADLTAIDVSGPFVGGGIAPPDPLNNLLYANGLAVRHVMTDGRFQVFDRRLVVDDERRVIAEGARVLTRIWDQLRAEGWLKG